MTIDTRKRMRCAVYTRKSTEEGLEQQFNSLDAQREACEAFILSQRHEGWVVLPTAYDDGGFSGGNMDRPGLVQLLADIRDRKVDVVVVYKVDRLTRSLSDFAKIVEIFDSQGVSFVSVTQQFNTTSSMGRLTLNVLLSFAQFEREVTGERIRDKVAASRRKGMWMGGSIPFGYDLKDKTYVINEPEARVVREMFKLYLQLKCVRSLQKELARRSYRTRVRVFKSGKTSGGNTFDRGHLYYFLNNRTYRGEAVHKGNAYPGTHEPIIDEVTWNQVQDLLRSNRIDRKSGKGFRHASLLAGILFDERGNRLSPSHSTKNGARYRYYVSQAVLQHEPDKAGATKRIPAQVLEDFICRQIELLFKNPAKLADELYGAGCPTEITQKIVNAAADYLAKPATPARRDSIHRSLLTKVVISKEQVGITFSRQGLSGLLKVGDQTETQSQSDNEQPITQCSAIRIKHSGRPGKILISEFDAIPERRHNQNLINMIVRANKWNQQFMAGKTTREIGQANNIHHSYVAASLRLAFLAPDITAAILDGKQPAELTAVKLYKPLPIHWAAQRQVLGFAAV
jgi:site-specific DNA recombinase